VGNLYVSKKNLSKGIVAIFFITLTMSSYATEVIGIHALFWAFMAGAIMPDNARFRNIFVEKVEDISLVVLLPLFFVFTGLRTQIGLLNDAYLWQVTGMIIPVAVTGKFIGSAVAAKFVGQSWKDSLVIGALMNTRGLIELVVLNIGYDPGVLKPALFAMMVIMALVTTFMTGPALDIIAWAFRSKTRAEAADALTDDEYNILISFGNAERGKSLLRLANALIKQTTRKTAITAMHLSPVNDLHLYNTDEYEKESFTPVIEEAENLQQKNTTLFKASGKINTEIIEITNKGNYDLLLIGAGKSIYEGSLLGKILGFTTRIINPERLMDQVASGESLFEDAPFDEHTRLILSGSNIPVGVFIDKGFQQTDTVFVPALSDKDGWLAAYIEKLVTNAGSFITIADEAHALKKIPAMVASADEPNDTTSDNIHFIKEATINKQFLQQQSLMVISAESWRKLIESKRDWLPDIPSVLILSGGAKHASRRGF
jgi:hypothetical protein